MNVAHYICLGALFLGMISCSVNRRETLQTTVDDYTKAIRRGDDDGILSFVRTDRANDFYKGVHQLNEIQISSFEAKTIYPDEKLSTALVTVLLEYYSNNAQSLVQSRRYLTFNFDEKAKAWFLDEASPLGKSELPATKKQGANQK